MQFSIFRGFCLTAILAFGIAPAGRVWSEPIIDSVDTLVKPVVGRVPFAPASISAVFAGGILTVTGDNSDNILAVSRDAAGNILVNGGAVAITGGVPTVTNTTLIRMMGLGGNDELRLDESGGQLP